MVRLISRTTVVLVAVLGSAAQLVGASSLERELEARLRGSWAVARVEVYSDCAGTYTNDHVTGAGVSSTGDRRFGPGELAKIDKLNLKRSGLDLFLTLSEPVLWPRVEGPFTLFDERQCKVQLMLELDRGLVTSEDVDAVLTAVDAVLGSYRSLEDARGSEEWNQRRREPYPVGYELTVARHEVWRAEQANAAVAARSQAALEAALRLLERVHRDPGYADGFAAGVEAMRSWRESDCGDLVAASYSSEEHGPPKERRSDRPWVEGFRDGQELSFNLLLVDRLGACLVPVPPLPGSGER